MLPLVVTVRLVHWKPDPPVRYCGSYDPAPLTVSHASVKVPSARDTPGALVAGGGSSGTSSIAMLTMAKPSPSLPSPAFIISP